jgi:1-pyrroline dehydrogenase
VSVATRTWKNFLGGDWVDSSEGRVREIINPANEQIIAKVQESSAPDVDRAVSAAEAAAESWANESPARRSLALFELAQAIADQAEAFARIESENVGKPLAQAHLEMSDWAVDNIRFFAGAARSLSGLASGEYVPGYTSMIRREPFGVVARIVPWNYPLLTAVLGIAPALATGNVVIVKPDEKTPLTMLRLAELAQDLLPAGVLNVVTGTGESVGAEIVDHERIQLVSLVGDVETGKKVAAGAARTLKRVHLELGGKAPVIVFADADLDDAARAVQFAGFFNCGQECMAATRVLVEAAVYDEFVERLVARVEAMRIGDPSVDRDVTMGPLISEGQRQRVQGFLSRALGGQAQIAVGGEVVDRPGFFMEPTVVLNPAQDSEIVQREVFGPVVTIQPFANAGQAMTWANDVNYGLVSSVWTESIRTALEVVRRLRFGTVWVNDHLILPSELPIGGYGKSGYGKDLSVYALEGFTQIKHVSLRFSRPADADHF